MNRLTLSLLFGLPLCAQVNGRPATAAVSGTAATAVTTSAQAYSRVLSDPVRDPWQQPDTVIAAMALSSSDTAAEIGQGAGYFGRRMATLARQVYVIDSDASVLQQAQLEAPPNLTTILSTQNNPRIPPNSLDKLIINGLLELSVDNLNYLLQLQPGLKATATVYVLDFFTSPSVTLPPSFSIQDISTVFSLFGFRLVQDLNIVAQQHLLTFAH